MGLICFASPNGGVGRTTLVANVARELARGPGRVIALDLDPQNTLGLHFGMDIHDGFGFLATLRYAADARAAWRAALRTTPCGVSLLPHGHVGLHGANAITEALGGSLEVLAEPVAEMLGAPDVTVVADLPAGPSPTLAALLALTDLLVIPLLADPASMAQLPGIESGRFTGAAARSGPPGLAQDKLAFVLNQVDVRGRVGRAITDSVVLHLGSRLLGIVHRDEHVPEAIASQRLVSEAMPDCRAARDIAAVARAIEARITGAVRPANYAPAVGATESAR